MIALVREGSGEGLNEVASKSIDDYPSMGLPVELSVNEPVEEPESSSLEHHTQDMSAADMSAHVEKKELLVELPPLKPLPSITVSSEVEERLSQATDEVLKGGVSSVISTMGRIPSKNATFRERVLLGAISVLSGRYESAIHVATDGSEESVLLERILKLAAAGSKGVLPDSIEPLSDRAALTRRTTAELKRIREFWEKIIREEESDRDSNRQLSMIAFISGNWGKLYECRRRVPEGETKDFISRLIKMSGGAAI